MILGSTVLSALPAARHLRQEKVVPILRTVHADADLYKRTGRQLAPITHPMCGRLGTNLPKMRTSGLRVHIPSGPR